MNILSATAISTTPSSGSSLYEKKRKMDEEKTLLSYIRYLIIFSRVLGSKDEEATLDERYERILYFFSSTSYNNNSNSNISELNDIIKENQLSFVSTLEGIIDITESTNPSSTMQIKDNKIRNKTINIILENINVTMVECELESDLWIVIGIDCFLPKDENFNIYTTADKNIFGDKYLESNRGSNINNNNNSTLDISSSSSDQASWNIKNWIKLSKWNSGDSSTEKDKSKKNINDIDDGNATQSEISENNDLNFGISLEGFYDKDIKRPLSVFKQSGNNNQEVVSGIFKKIIENIYIMSLALFISNDQRRRNFSDFIFFDNKDGNGSIVTQIADLRKQLRKELDKIQSKDDDDDENEEESSDVGLKLSAKNEGENDINNKNIIKDLEIKINELLVESPVEELRKKFNLIIPRYLSLYPISRISLFHALSGIQLISVDPSVFLKVQFIIDDILKIGILDKKLTKVSFLFQWNLLWSSFSLEKFPALFNYLRHEWEWFVRSGSLNRKKEETKNYNDPGYFMDFCDGKNYIKIQNIFGNDDDNNNGNDIKYLSVYIFNEIVLFIETDTELETNNQNLSSSLSNNLKKMIPLIEENHERISRHAVDAYENKLRFVYVNKVNNLIKLSSAFLYGVADGANSNNKRGYYDSNKNNKKLQLLKIAPNLDQMGSCICDEVIEAMNNIWVQFDNDEDDDIESTILVSEKIFPEKRWWISAIKSGSRQLYLVIDSLSLDDAIKERNSIKTKYFASTLIPGATSFQAALIAVAVGFTNVKNYKGSANEWFSKQNKI